LCERGQQKLVHAEVHSELQHESLEMMGMHRRRTLSGLRRNEKRRTREEPAFFTGTVIRISASGSQN
jgi:hypothetical protein